MPHQPRAADLGERGQQEQHQRADHGHGRDDSPRPRPPRRRGRVLDVGCGNGRISRLVAPRVAHGTGIDLSGPTPARARASPLRLPRPGRAGGRAGGPGRGPGRHRAARRHAALTPGRRGRSG
ncbi:class I SAM-dependent methyltransferase [Saccharothrix sp. 6-C]|nr:class I SAM-dependent methyltransferase [Saccharothrix sp. 6-C]